MLIQQKVKYVFSFWNYLKLVLVLCVPISAYGYEKEAPVLSNVQEVKFKARADDDFLLVADYYAGEKKSGGVIVLHDCKSDRSRC